MDRHEADFRLPPIYQQVITWLDEGVVPEEIAARLEIEPSAVPTLIALAQAKLARAAEDAGVPIAARTRRPPAEGSEDARNRP